MPPPAASGSWAPVSPSAGGTGSGTQGPEHVSGSPSQKTSAASLPLAESRVGSPSAPDWAAAGPPARMVSTIAANPSSGNPSFLPSFLPSLQLSCLYRTPPQSPHVIRPSTAKCDIAHPPSQPGPRAVSAPAFAPVACGPRSKTSQPRPRPPGSETLPPTGEGSPCPPGSGRPAPPVPGPRRTRPSDRGRPGCPARERPPPGCNGSGPWTARPISDENRPCETPRTRGRAHPIGRIAPTTRQGSRTRPPRRGPVGHRRLQVSDPVRGGPQGEMSDHVGSAPRDFPGRSPCSSSPHSPRAFSGAHSGRRPPVGSL